MKIARMYSASSRSRDNTSTGSSENSKRGRPCKSAEKLSTDRYNAIALKAASTAKEQLSTECRNSIELMNKAWNRLTKMMAIELHGATDLPRQDNNDELAERRVLAAIRNKVQHLNNLAGRGGDDNAKIVLSVLHQLVVENTDREHRMLTAKARVTGLSREALDAALEAMREGSVPIARLTKRERKDKLDVISVVTDMWHQICEEKKGKSEVVLEEYLWARGCTSIIDCVTTLVA